MTVKKLAGGLAKDAAATTVHAARHPIGSAARVAGVVKGSAGAGLGLVRGVVRGRGEAETVPATVVDPPASPAEPAGATTAKTPPGPDIVPKPVPTLDELPEPVVISADDETPEPVHTEPKVASRSASHGGPTRTADEADAYVDELDDDPAS